MEEAALKKQLREKSFSRVYLLFGEEPWLVRHYTAQIAKKSVDAFEEFNLQRFDDEASADQIAEAAEALPMMSERKCVIVSNYNAETNASQTAKMAELLADPPESCVLVFSCTREINWKKSSKWKNFREAVAAAGSVVEFPARDNAALSKFLVSLAQERGCSLPPDVCRYLLALCGSQMSVLENEMEKVCAFAGSGELTRAHCDAVCVQTQEAVSFRMANALTAGDYDTAYRLLDLLLYQREEPVSLLASISSAYVDLYRARAAIDSGQNALELSAPFDYKKMEFKLKNAARACRKFDLEQLRNCLDVLYQADRELKGTRTDPRVVLEKAMARLLLIAAKK